MKKRNVGIVLSYAYTFLNMVIGLFMSSFMLRQLGDVEYGLYQTVSSFATYLVLLEFGTGSVMSRNVVVAKNKNDADYLKKNITTIWYMTVILSLIILIVASVFYFNIGFIYSKTMSYEQVLYAQRIFIWIVGYLVCSFFVQTLNGLLLGFENYKFGQIISIVRLLMRTLILVSVILFYKHAIIISIADFSVSLIAFAVTFMYCKKKYHISLSVSDFNWGIFRQSLPLCSALLIQSLVNQANNNVDKFIIGIQISLESVAIYSVAQYIYSIFSAITTIPISMYLPQIAAEIGDDYNGKRITRTLLSPARLICILGGTVLFGFFACGKQFISIVYGDNKVEAWLYSLIIMIPMLLNMITGPIINVLDVLNKRQSRSYALLFTTILNIIMTICFINLWGIIGAVIATAIATILGQIIIMNIYYEKILEIDIKWLYLNTMRKIIPFQLVAAAIGFCFGILITNRIASFVASAAVYVIISFGLIYRYGINTNEKKLIKSKLLILKHQHNNTG